MKRKTDKAKEKDAEKVKDKDNEKVKEKDKPVERRSTRRSSRRHSKRRKKSSSPSPERDESGNEDNNVPLKSPVVETEPKVEPTVKSSEKIESGGIQSRLRRSRQRQEVVEASSSKEEKPKECSDEWQEDTSFWEESNSKQEESEPKERDRVTRSKAISDAKKLLEQSTPQTKSHRTRRSSRSRNSEKNESVEEENRSLEPKEADNIRNKPGDESSDTIDQVHPALNDLVTRSKSQSPQPLDNSKPEMVSEVTENNNDSLSNETCKVDEKQDLPEEKKDLSEEMDLKEEGRGLCEEKVSQEEMVFCEIERDSHDERGLCEEERDSLAVCRDLQQGKGNEEEGKGNEEEGKGNKEEGKGNEEEGKGNEEEGKGNEEEGKANEEEGNANEVGKDNQEEKKDSCEDNSYLQEGKDTAGEERDSNAKVKDNHEEGKVSCKEIISDLQTPQIISNETELPASVVSKDEPFGDNVSEEHTSAGIFEQSSTTLEEKLSPQEGSEHVGRSSSTPTPEIKSEEKFEDEKLSVKDEVDYETDEEKPTKGSDSDESEKDSRNNRNLEEKEYDRANKRVSPKFIGKFSESEVKTTSEHPNRVKLCRKPRETISVVDCHEKESNNDLSKLKTEKNSLSSTKENKERRIKIRRSVSPGRRENDDKENRAARKRHHSSRSSHSPSPIRRYERVRLKRTGSSYCQEEKEKELCEVQSTTKKSECDSKEAEKHAEEIQAEIEEPIRSSSRKRRWGASKICRPIKKPVVSISSDSLKNLIPGAKPLSISEVQLTEDDSPTESKGELDDSWTLEGEKPAERDGYEEIEEKPFVLMPEVPKIAVANTEERGKTPRKISIVSDDARTLQRSPSPPRHKSSDVLFITNLVRPFTVNQLRELLARTGTIVNGGFWIDKIKSKCYVRYETEAEARETRHALHGVRWPVSNPKQLCVDFGKKEDMELAQAMSEADQIPRKTEPLKIEHSVEDWVAEQVREREHREREKEKERERERGKVKERHVPLEAVEHSRNIKAQTSVREWDLGKVGQMSPPDRDVRQDDRSKDRERKVRREKLHRSRSNSPDISARKVRKKEEDAPAKLLDDLFKKTKCTPCIYWLPLTAEQIVVKEEIRRKHMAEHERRLAEMRKAERERERIRMQRQHRRPGSERDKRKRRSTSPSFKK